MTPMAAKKKVTGIIQIYSKKARDQVFGIGLKFAKEAGVPEVTEDLFACVDELIKNAVKANYKFLLVVDKIAGQLLKKNPDKTPEQIKQNIFDILKNVHNLEKNWKDYLFSASMLHDVGKIISFNNHQEHSEYIISHSQIIGYTEREKKIISKIALYHKNQNIDDEDYEIKVLAGILRIADSLDKSGVSLFKDLKYDPYNKKLTIFLQKGKMFNIFSYYIEQKKKLLTQTLKIKVEVLLLD